MALTVNHPTLKEQVVYAHTASCGASPIACAVRVPFRGKVVKVGQVLHGTITSADCSTTVARITGIALAAAGAGAAPGSGTAITGSPLVTDESNSAAGTHNYFIPTGANNVIEDDLILFTPASASGTDIPCTYYAVIQVA
jgi:hypothetical protein